MSLIRGIRDFFWELIVGCSHQHVTRPFTLEARSYKVCLDCGRQLPYSVEKMHLVHAWEMAQIAKPQAQVAELVPGPVGSGRAKVAAFSGEGYSSGQAIA